MWTGRTSSGNAWREGVPVPTVGITCDILDARGRARYASTLGYAQAIVRAGATPVLLAPIPESVAMVLRVCDGFVLTGGDDPRTEPFGMATHPAATPTHPDRQAFESELLGHLLDGPHAKPLLGVCLGMQLMALAAGGTLDQHMPDTCPTAADHVDRDHAVVPEPGAARWLGTSEPGVVHSWHHQAVAEPGSLRVIARAPDGLIEAVALENHPHAVGVQWHPERTGDDSMGHAVFARLVAACRTSMQRP